MLRFIPLVLLSGCIAKYDPKPADTNLDPSKRDWIRVYEKEIQIAIENDDREAWHFFWREYMLEKSKINQ